DFSKELNYTKAIMARQGDKGITVTVKPFLNGLQMDTSGGTFTLKGTTPSNRYVDNVATSVTSEEVTFSLDGTFMSEAGYYKHCYVEYRKDNQILTTQDIIFFSLGVSDISQGQADEYVSQLEELIRKYNETFDAFMAEIKGRVDSLNQQITDLTGQAKTLQDKLDALKEEISKLGNLQVMYSNSIDFGDYDYSENPNLMPYITEPWVGPLLGNGHTVKDSVKRVITHTKTRTANSGDILSLGLGIPCTAEANNRYLITTLRPSTTYTLSVTMSVGSDWTGETNTIGVRLRYLNEQGGIELPINALIPANVERDKMVTHTFTGITKDNVTSITNCYVEIFSLNSEYKGTVSVSYDVKLKAHYPNLLDGPYWLGKVPLGENIADPTVVFPHKTSEYMVYGRRNTENYIADQTYTISMKATKLTVQSFAVYIAAGRVKVGDMKPTEGLANTWELTFTVTKQHIDSGVTNYLEIYQYPSATKGAVQIEWLKLEKGNTRTPNISEYKYRGTGMRDSNNPKDYVWDLAPEYVEDNLATDIKISEITGKANNYTDGKVSEINSQLTASINEVDTTAKDAQTKANANATAIDELDNKIDERINDTATTTLTVTNGNTGSAKLYREGKTVSIYFVALNGKSSGGNDSTILTIPEGYRPPISFEQLVGSIDRSTLNSAQLSIGADGAIKWRRNSSYGSDYTFAITYTI
ncbi:TPA: hypothetical protein ACY4KO_003135, partial [Enterococcus faecium 1,230,933]